MQGAVLGACKRATVSSLCSQTVSDLVQNEREQHVRASLAVERHKPFLNSELAEELLDRSTLLHYGLRLQIRAMAAWKIYLHFAKLVLKSSRQDLLASAPGEPLQFPIALISLNLVAVELALFLVAFLLYACSAFVIF